MRRGALAETFVRVQVGLRIYLTPRSYFSVKLLKLFLPSNTERHRPGRLCVGGKSFGFIAFRKTKWRSLNGILGNNREIKA